MFLTSKNVPVYYLTAYICHATSYALFDGSLGNIGPLYKKKYPSQLDETQTEDVSESKKKYYDSSYEHTFRNNKEIKRFKKVDSNRDVRNVDIDKIVDKVKTRLEEEFFQKYGERDFFNKISKSLGYSSKDNKKIMIRPKEYEVEEETSKPWYEEKPNFDGSETKGARGRNIKNHKEMFHTEYNTPKFAKPLESQEFILEKVNLFAKNNSDSYEEYVIPKKEDYDNENKFTEEKKNLFSHRQNKDRINEYKPRERPFETKVKNIPIKLKVSQTKSTPEDMEYYADETAKAQKIEARTEKLWQSDYDVLDDRKIGPATVTEKAKSNAPKYKKLKGTMRPTKHRYKMSSPNYLAKIPKVVEKYKFDEPLPENDQNSENLEPFGNPPARINAKVKVLK